MSLCENSGNSNNFFQLSNEIIKPGIELETILGTTFVNFFSKCVDLESAKSIFESMKIKCSITWNSMIHGYAKNGERNKLLELLEQIQIQKKEIKPCEITFTCLLTGLSNVGEVDKALGIYYSL